MNWIEFLDAYNIDYITFGPNTRKGEVSIKCPWCGDDDPSFHMGINPIKNAYGCWRSVDHAGKSAPKLVQAILGCSKTQAKLIADQFSRPDPESLDDALSALTNDAKPTVQARQRLVMPHEFKRLRPVKSAARFWNYLEKRGFDDIERLTEMYSLKYCTTGPWKDRIIFPLYQDDDLRSWVGRALVNPVHAPRYKVLAESEGALVNRNAILFGEHLLTGGPVLYVCEGPLDAMKIMFYGEPAHATAVFGTHMSRDQAAILSSIAPLYERLVILFDPEAIEAAFHSMDMLSPYNVSIGALPPNTEDPGSMSRQEVRGFIKSQLR